MNFLFFMTAMAILVFGGLGHLAAGIAKIDIGNGVKFTVPAWLGGGALFLALAMIMPP